MGPRMRLVKHVPRYLAEEARDRRHDGRHCLRGDPRWRTRTTRRWATTRACACGRRRRSCRPTCMHRWRAGADAETPKERPADDPPARW